MVIGGVNTYHLRATRRGFWGLVVFPRFASVRRTAAADIGGGGALSAPTVFFRPTTVFTSVNILT